MGMGDKVPKYIAIVCFSILAVGNIASLVSDFSSSSASILQLLTLSGPLLITIALLGKRPMLSTVGFAVWTLSPFISWVWTIGWAINADFAWWHGWLFRLKLITLTLHVAAYVCAMLACIMPKKARLFGSISILLAVILVVAPIIRGIVDTIGGYASIAIIGYTDGYTNVVSIIVWLLMATGVWFLSLTYDSSAKKTEKISRLKTLLDRGILTQEEFDTKKKQLLGM